MLLLFVSDACVLCVSALSAGVMKATFLSVNKYKFYWSHHGSGRGQRDAVGAAVTTTVTVCLWSQKQICSTRWHMLCSRIPAEWTYLFTLLWVASKFALDFSNCWLVWILWCFRHFIAQLNQTTITEFLFSESDLHSFSDFSFSAFSTQ